MSTAVIGYTPELNGEDYGLGLSVEAQENLKQYQEIYGHYYFPVSRPEDYVTEFYSLVNEWKRDTQVTSTANNLIMHPAYQRIIGMGKGVIPLLLRELQDRPDHWFWALEAITGVHPILPIQQGKVDEMAKAWLNWAEQNGYEW